MTYQSIFFENGLDWTKPFFLFRFFICFYFAFLYPVFLLFWLRLYAVAAFVFK